MIDRWDWYDLNDLLQESATEVRALTATKERDTTRMVINRPPESRRVKPYCIECDAPPPRSKGWEQVCLVHSWPNSGVSGRK